MNFWCCTLIFEEARQLVNFWTAYKDKSFFRRGIRMLYETYENVIANDDQYCLLMNLFLVFINKGSIVCKKY